MKNTILLLLLFISSLTLLAQESPTKDYLLATAIYDATFNSIDAAAELKISDYLKTKSLTNLVDSGIISREDMMGFALPLGVYKNEDPLDYYNGMFAMWQAKAYQMKKTNSRIDVNIMATAFEALTAMRQPTWKMDLLTYRADVLVPAKDSLSALHLQMQPLYSAKRKIFMDLIVANLSANILLAYNIQEMTPPTHMLADRRIKDINPLFKAFYLDRLLQEAGCEFVAYFPARYDAVNSFGPFQFTNIALSDILKNTRLVKEFKLFEDMSALKGVEDHALAAAFFAYDNWERLSYVLNSAGLLDDFNSYFEDYNSDEDKKRQLRIFIAGVTACMHHHPPNTFLIVKNYLKKVGSNLDALYYEMMAESGNSQLQKYYRSSAEAYLMLKLYGALMR